MNRKKNIRKYLYEATRDFVRNGHYNILAYITTGDGKQIKKHFGSEHQCLIDLMANFMEKYYFDIETICQEVKAKEVAIVCPTITCIDPIDPNLEKPHPSNAFFVHIENNVDFDRVTLPYRLSADGEIIFGRELWEFRSKKDMSIWKGFIH